MTPEDKAFVRDWLTAYGHRLANNFAKLAVIPYFLGAVIDPFFIEPPYSWIGASFLLALSLESVLWLLIEPMLRPEKLLFGLRWHAVASNLLVVSGAATFLLTALVAPSYRPAQIIVAGMAWGSVGWTVGLFTPVLGVNIGSVYLITIAVIMAGLHFWGIPEIAPLSFATFAVSLTIIGYFVRQFKRFEEHALLQKRTRDLERENRILELKAKRGEMQLAAALQSHLDLRISELTTAGHDFRFFHVPYGILGGDLLLTRTLPNSSQIVVVGDVTGKGVQAAMVVQAVQSLWAAQLDFDEFNPSEWLALVNKTLLSMGNQSGSLTLTLGLIVISTHSTEYYCAGHLPLYILRSEDDRDQIDAIIGSGMPLGITPHFEIACANVITGQTDNYTLILGSDGVLDWETRKHKKRLINLLNALESHGSDAIAEHPVDDDKILVIIKPSEAA